MLQGARVPRHRSLFLPICSLQTPSMRVLTTADKVYQEALRMTPINGIPWVIAIASFTSTKRFWNCLPCSTTKMELQSLRPDYQLSTPSNWSTSYESSQRIPTALRKLAIITEQRFCGMKQTRRRTEQLSAQQHTRPRRLI